MNAQQAHAVYLKSKAKVDAGKGTKTDEFIVDLWFASENLYAKNEHLKKELTAEKCRASLLSSKIDMLQTTVSHLNALDVVTVAGDEPTAQPESVKFTGNFSDYFASLAPQV